MPDENRRPSPGHLWFLADIFLFTLHGLALGLVRFTLGYLLIDTGDPFWTAAIAVRWWALAGAVTLWHMPIQFMVSAVILDTPLAAPSPPT